MSNEENPPGFVRSKLPWIVGAGTLVVFLLTLNHWVSLRSIAMTAKVAGWGSDLPMQWPLFLVLTFPFRFLPVGIQPIALNFFTALCAGVTVALLARSIALLPHDRTHEQRVRERSEFSLLSIRLAWVPVVLACAALAFQLTFWEHATSLTGEMLDLLFFAYAIRCLLEYRIGHQERWLSKMALAYGLAVTNNWAMIGFFPLFLGAVVWIKGIRFFDPGFLVRMAGLGIAGLLLYLLLPVIWMVKGDGEYTFFQVLRVNWTLQKSFLIDATAFRNRALLLSLTSILPVVLMGIRWRTSVGDVNAAGSFLTNLAFRIIHLFFLGACLWIAFDPKYSPRALGLGVAYLTFYYLGALVIGYYSGYALLVFSEPPRKNRLREAGAGKVFNPIIRFAILAAMLLVPAGLIVKNYASVRGDNGAVLREFTTRLAESLPKTPAYLLSDDPYALALLEAHLGAEGKVDNYILVNTGSLEVPAYHQKLNKLHGPRWPSPGAPEELGAAITQTEIQTLIRTLASSNIVTYIHPSFGYYFEVVFPQPNGQAYRLLPFADNQVLPPALNAEQIQANEDYWNRNGDYLQRVMALRDAKSLDAEYVARYSSRALNDWGAARQQSGNITEAGKHFDQAWLLNTNNVAARANREFNQALQNGKSTPPSATKTVDERFGGYRSWDRLLAENGPFDHPEYCEILGQNLLSQTLFRQAGLQFSRVIAFQPTNFNARVSFVKCLNGGFWTDQSMAELDRMTSEFKVLSDVQQVDITNLRAAAFFKQNDFEKAEQTLITAKNRLPEQTGLAESLFELYRTAGRFSNAVAIINDHLANSPTNVTVQLQKAELLMSHRDYVEAHETLDKVLALAPKNLPAQLYHAFAYIQENQHDRALAVVDRILLEDSDNSQALLYKGIAHLEQEKGDLEKAREAFDRLIALEPGNQAALRNRAILNLRAKRWGEAREDYELLRRITPKSHAIMYGLGEIAFNENKVAEATRYYEAYLRFAPAEGGRELEEEKKRVQERLQQLKTPGK